ncbi:hypothetical protein LY90DRAFT_515739 [Neocallimastix californiae]|uniref:Uncharacterized protein n=1 Tax=Neocallimastix californiae TaxID=1754190 RepID=A0A1Y2AHX1_9FUNG|nr:hypothetical protein LY90DRAFT_515739 [Neocallimastix californiae]|eukprot:ORY22106.1 hypothetical protein LY90DRAFT_515739 [Neocallimastix californiae]
MTVFFRYGMNIGFGILFIVGISSFIRNCIEFRLSYCNKKKENGSSELIITYHYSQNSITDLKETYDCYKDICLYLGCTHASQCLFGNCTFKDEAKIIRHDIPFDNHPVGLCRYNAKVNLMECNVVYVKLILFRKS